ncbi:hypothetical protein Dvina_36155 [Dactylosporangium vinaceum]|nr:hypothetical protein [Dactylosporangium vinaceum]UAB93636.1 hypothetical protein Dvina_36155 [Dactylosporangium vinaceum]
MGDEQVAGGQGLTAGQKLVTAAGQPAGQVADLADEIALQVEQPQQWYGGQTQHRRGQHQRRSDEAVGSGQQSLVVFGDDPADVAVGDLCDRLRLAAHAENLAFPGGVWRSVSVLRRSVP